LAADSVSEKEEDKKNGGGDPGVIYIYNLEE